MILGAKAECRSLGELGESSLVIELDWLNMVIVEPWLDLHLLAIGDLLGRPQQVQMLAQLRVHLIQEVLVLQSLRFGESL